MTRLKAGYGLVLRSAESLGSESNNLQGRRDLVVFLTGWLKYRPPPEIS